jgi:hypothetical protein
MNSLVQINNTIQIKLLETFENNTDYILRQYRRDFFIDKREDLWFVINSEAFDCKKTFQTILENENKNKTKFMYDEINNYLKSDNIDMLRAILNFAILFNNNFFYQENINTIFKGTINFNYLNNTVVILLYNLIQILGIIDENNYEFIKKDDYESAINNYQKQSFAVGEDDERVIELTDGEQEGGTLFTLFLPLIITAILLSCNLVDAATFPNSALFNRMHLSTNGIDSKLIHQGKLLQIENQLQIPRQSVPTSSVPTSSVPTQLSKKQKVDVPKFVRMSMKTLNDPRLLSIINFYNDANSLSAGLSKIESDFRLNADIKSYLNDAKSFFLTITNNEFLNIPAIRGIINKNKGMQQIIEVGRQFKRGEDLVENAKKIFKNKDVISFIQIIEPTANIAIMLANQLGFKQPSVIDLLSNTILVSSGASNILVSIRTSHMVYTELIRDLKSLSPADREEALTVFNGGNKITRTKRTKRNKRVKRTKKNKRVRRTKKYKVL